MNLLLEFPKKKKLKGIFTICGSKSESNRLLILKKIYSNLTVENLSNSDDTIIMEKILSSTSNFADVHHAGTTMRFLTAYFALIGTKEVELTGSIRMRKRPIKILVDALNDLGANIRYEKQLGYPPIFIKPSKKIKEKVTIRGNVSSQYISALMLIAPKLKKGLEINLIEEITSIPYIEMTLSILNELGISASFEKNNIKVDHKLEIDNKVFLVEADWSSASYWYSLVALGKLGSRIVLSSYNQNSLQGDSCIVEIYKEFGVKTIFTKNSIILEKIKNSSVNCFKKNLKNAPDIAQTITVTCFALGINCSLSGLHTLKIKETNRLEALKNELLKLGAEITITHDSLYLKSSNKINSNVSINTYNDHRMAMAFSPLSLITPIKILNSEVVSKSYSKFWLDLKKIGIIQTKF